MKGYGHISVKVNLEEIIEGIDFQFPETYGFLNINTGKIVIVDSDALSAAEDDEPYMGEGDIDIAIDVVENFENYIKIPEEKDINEYDIMEDFCLSLEDAHKKEILIHTIQGKGAFRRFKDKVIDLGIRDDWFTYRDERIKQFVIEWCEAHNIDYA